MGVSFETCLRRRGDILIECHCYVLLRRHHEVLIRHGGDIPLRRIGDAPWRRCWVFHLRCICDVAGTYRETFLRRRYYVLLPGGVKLVRNSIKSKFTCNVWGIVFDGKGSWSFVNDFTRNAVIFVVFNWSSSHTDNWKNTLLVKVMDRLMVLMIALVQQKKNSINFSKGKTLLKLCVVHCNGYESYLYINKTEIWKFKAKDNISWYKFGLGSISKDFTKDGQGKFL